MAEDQWRDDTHPAVAAVERRLSDLGAAYLYRVHLDLHARLGLPDVPVSAVQSAYRTRVLSKAAAPTGEMRSAGNRAVRIFEELKDRSLTPRHLPQLVEAVTENWYAHGLVEDHAQAHAMRATLIGLVQAQAATPEAEPRLAAWRSVLDGEQNGALAWAGEHAAEHIRHLRERTRHAVAGMVMDAVVAGDQPATLATRLTGTFGTLNRDWRRVAITEVAAARAHGYLLGIPVGERVSWFAAPDACGHCARLHGREFTVTREPGNQRTEVWPGKTNVGRAASLKRRDGTLRPPEEVWRPTIPMHPNCRCRWVRVARKAAGVSDRLEAYLAELANS